MSAGEETDGFDGRSSAQANASKNKENAIIDINTQTEPSPMCDAPSWANNEEFTVWPSSRDATGHQPGLADRSVDGAASIRSEFAPAAIGGLRAWLGRSLFEPLAFLF